MRQMTLATAALLLGLISASSAYPCSRVLRDSVKEEWGAGLAFMDPANDPINCGSMRKYGVGSCLCSSGPIASGPWQDRCDSNFPGLCTT